MCSAMAYALDFEVVDTFMDESEDRPELERAMQAIVDGEADTFMSFNRTTVSRNIKEFTEFHKNFTEPHTRLQLINPDTFPDDV
jgi:DNA invertase Pin-like site-specific DNA recombinase